MSECRCMHADGFNLTRVARQSKIVVGEQQGAHSRHFRCGAWAVKVKGAYENRSYRHTV